jgi:membrane AbrB-like protein
VACAFGAAGLGVAAFQAAGLPLPWLLGPIFACLVAALAGLPLRGLRRLNDVMRTILGLAVGASLTPAVVAGLPALWPTLVLVPVMTLAIGLVGVPYFRRACGYDPATAYYAAMPGGLQDMLALGEEAGGNLRALALIHATRVMVIVVALPFLLQGIWGADLTGSPGAPARDLPPGQLVWMVLAALAGWRVAKRVGLPGASILGPLIAAGALSVGGVIEHRPPAEAIWAAQFFIGMTIGSSYAGITAAELRRDVLAALGFCAILIALTLAFVEPVVLLGLAPGLETLLAFAPGGQAELAVLALVAGADMAFVIAHHLVRLFAVILGAPVAARWFAKRPD